MSELTTYIHLGFHHIVDPGAVDHILFLLALAAIYRLRDWRESLWVITAFTLGHSLTLALAVTNALVFPTRWIEFLIPLTIVATCVENLAASVRAPGAGPRRYRAIFAGLFGLVHGAGFAEYLKSLFLDRIAVPLFGFNVGIELGQLVVLSLAAVALALCDALLVSLRSTSPAASALRLRVLGVSLVVLVVASGMALERRPW